MRRACASGVVLVALLSVDLFAHASLRFSTPMEGVALGDAPATIQLTLTERPDPALSEIHVVDRSGMAYEAGRPSLVNDDPMSIAITVRRLPTGIYTVNWRVVSAVDGHASAGAFAFGVRQSPSGVASTAAPTVSVLEVVARWLLNAGLVLLIGAAFGDLTRIAPSRALSLATAGWILSCAGIALLFGAQARTAGSSLRLVIGSSVGRTLLWRSVTLTAAGIALLLARHARGARIRTTAMATVMIAALATAALQVASGHAASGSTLAPLEIVAQWAHVTASAIWIGGLAALLFAVRGEVSDEKALAVSRFSGVALIGIVLVLSTGSIRAVAELTSWSDLTRTVYGRTLMVKVALFLAIAILGGANRLRSVPSAHRDLSPLRRIGSGELTFAAAALGAAGFLAALPPPAAARVLPGITASGVDFATTVRVSFAAVSNQPGPNRFSARISDYDSGSPVSGAAVLLRFVPVDDPERAGTSLTLSETAPGEYSAAGTNLAFDGHWRVFVQVQRGTGTVEVALDAEIDAPPLPVEIQHVENQVNYNALVPVGGFIRLSFDPERAGRSRLYISVYDVIQDERLVQRIVATHRPPGGSARTLTLRRLSGGRFVADIDLAEGRNTFVVLSKSPDDIRARARVEIDIPRR